MQSNFEEIRTNGEALYKTFGEVYCPYFKEVVSFSAQGLEHLKYKRRDRARTDTDQYMRFKLIHLAPEIIKLSHTVQGVLETNKFEQIRVHNRTELVLKYVTYYEFIAILKRNRVKVIIKQIESGTKVFWSIIPFWGMNTATMTRLLHEGDPEED